MCDHRSAYTVGHDLYFAVFQLWMLRAEIEQCDEVGDALSHQWPSDVERCSRKAIVAVPIFQQVQVVGVACLADAPQVGSNDDSAVADSIAAVDFVLIPCLALFAEVYLNLGIVVCGIRYAHDAWHRHLALTIDLEA